MPNAVVAVFSDRASAEAAAERVRASGLGTLDVRLHDDASNVSNAGALGLDEFATGGLISNVSDLLDDLFGRARPPDEAHDYADAVRREGTLMTVRTDGGDSAKRVAALLEECGATRVSTLPQPGLEED